MHKPYERIANNGMVRSSRRSTKWRRRSSCSAGILSRSRPGLTDFRRQPHHTRGQRQSLNALRRRHPHLCGHQKHEQNDRFFYSADGELLFVPQLGRLIAAHRTRHSRPCTRRNRPHPSRHQVPRRIARTTRKPAVMSSRTTVSTFRLPELGAIGANGLANSRDFLTPVRCLRRPRQREPSRSSQNFRAPRGPPTSTTPRLTSSHGTEITRLTSMTSPPSTASIRSASTTPTHPSTPFSPRPARFPAQPTSTSPLFPPRWIVAEHTFRPPWFHRNLHMNEFMGLIQGVYDAKADGFAPGGASLHNCMSGHGPDAETFARASTCRVGDPSNSTAPWPFMFETRFVCRPTKFAMDTAARQHEYYTCWQTLKKNLREQQPKRQPGSSSEKLKQRRKQAQTKAYAPSVAGQNLQVARNPAPTARYIPAWGAGSVPLRSSCGSPKAEQERPPTREAFPLLSSLFPVSCIATLRR